LAVKVITDSSAALPRKLRRDFDIGVASLVIHLDGVDYPDDTEDHDTFYAALKSSSSFATTSQPSAQDFVTLMEERVAAGHDVVGVFVSPLMSGTMATAALAREMVLETYPDATIEIVDGRSNSMELGFAVLAAAESAAAGATAAEAAAAATERTLHTRFLFVPATLEYLRRGGRIGNASALIGTLLKINPILTVAEGITDQFAKVRTLRRAHNMMVEKFMDDLRERGGLGDVIVHHIDAEAAGIAFVKRISDIVGRQVELIPSSLSAGAHVGPGTVALIYYTIDRMDHTHALSS